MSHLLTDYDLKQIQAVSEPANFEPLPGTSDENPVDALVDPEPSLAAPLDHDTPQFLHDTVINKILVSKFSEISDVDTAALPCLPRVSLTKPLQSIIFDVDSCVADVLVKWFYTFIVEFCIFDSRCCGDSVGTATRGGI